MSKITCPSCGFHRAWELRRNKQKCKRCRKEFSSKIYPIKGFRVTEEEWLNCIEIFLKERTVKRMMQENHRSHCLNERIVMFFRQKMLLESVSIFEGPIELDETYVGGQRKNKCLHIRRIKAKRGHGTEKLPIVGFFDRATGQVIVFVEPKKLDLSFILSKLKIHAKEGSAIYTDGFKMYRQIQKYGFHHEYVDHDGGEYVRGEVHTNNIEGFWGILKRKMGCIGGMRREYLPLFVAEIVWRFNHRNLFIQDQKQALWSLMKSI